MVFQRITVDSKVFGDKPCIRRLRFPVSRLLGLLAAGETPESILQPYPYLEQEEIQKALHCLTPHSLWMHSAQTTLSRHLSAKQETRK